MKHPIMRVSILALITIVAGCGGDTQSASDSIGSTAAVQNADAQPASVSPESKIGRLPLVASAPSSGKCQVTPFGQFSAVRRNIVYEGDFPLRVIKVAVGDSTRGFPPMSLEATIRRETGIAEEETESIQVFFDASGNVQSGNRRYLSSGSNPANERQELFPTDAEAVKQLALQVMDQCKDSTSS
jgi:hypothetical protein